MIINSQLIANKMPENNINIKVYSEESSPPYSVVHIIPKFNLTSISTITGIKEEIIKSNSTGYNLQLFFSQLSDIYRGKNEILLTTLIDFSQGHSIINNQFSTLGKVINNYFSTYYNKNKIQIKQVFRTNSDAIIISFDNNGTSEYLKITQNSFQLTSRY